MVAKITRNKYFVPKKSLLFNNPLLCSQQAFILGRSGFTLVELIIVVAVLGILAAMAIPTFNNYIKTTKVTACIADIRTIDKAMMAYVIDKNALPSDGAAGLDEIGMSALKDPWKRPFEFKINSAATELKDIANHALNTDYDLYSLGEDGLSVPASGGAGNDDDVARSNNGSFVGVRP